MGINIRKPSINRLPQPRTLIEALKQSEEAGRISHKSHDKITDDSYIKFIDMMRKLEHFSTLEFATIYMTIPLEVLNKSNKEARLEGNLRALIKRVIRSKYSKAYKDKSEYYLTSNLRVFEEAQAFIEKKSGVKADYMGLIETYWSGLTEKHSPRITFVVETSISVTRQGNRHRNMSTLEESTTYVNYTKDKHGAGPTISYNKLLEGIAPFEEWEEAISFRNYTVERPEKEEIGIILDSAEESYKAYSDLVARGIKHSMAREVLQLYTATTVYWCGYLSDWMWFIKLRGSNHAHPDIRSIAHQVRNSLNSEKIFEGQESSLE